MTRDQIWNDILRERDRQDRIHGPDLPPAAIPTVLGEEFGEVCEAINDHLHRDRLREELVQVAAVAVKAIEHLARTPGADTLDHSRIFETILKTPDSLGDTNRTP